MTTGSNGKGTVWRVSNAQSVAALEKDLLVRQIPVIRVEPLNPPKAQSRKRVKLNDLCNYTEQMETGYALGMPLIRMFSSCIECTASPYLRTILTEMKTDLERGESLTATMERWPNVFDSIYVSFVASGEKGSGRMDEAFAQIKSTLLRNQIIRTKLRSVMMMPMVTLIMLVLVLAFMMTVIVPKFQAMFSATGVPLPFPTQVLVSISEAVRAYPFLTGVAGFAFVLGVMRASSIVNRFPCLHSLILKLPIYGKLQRKVMLANFSRTLGQLVNAGVPFVQALYLARDLSNNVIYRLSIARAIISVSKGEKIAKALLSVKALFGPEIIHQVSFGEESGAIPSLLKTITERQDRELIALVEDMRPVLEAVMIAIMAALVGGVIIALYLPIFGMGQTLTGSR